MLPTHAVCSPRPRREAARFVDVKQPDVIVVDARGRNQRLDRYLAAAERWGSRAQVQRMIAAGNVEVDGRPARPSQVVRPGQTIQITGLPAIAAAAGVEPEDIPLDVIYEDDALLVINKPAGLVVHPAAGNWRGTLVSALLHHWGGSLPGLDPLRPGLVHRLDKDTSGVIVVAKDAATLADLGRQFRRREVEKRYVALVWGRLRQPRGTVNSPIGRNPVQRKRMAVRPGGRDAVTDYQVIAQGREVSYVRLFPRTGRTHQIRVHLAALGHPIVGDAVYGGGRRRPEPLIQRQALHAEAISFTHPKTGERVQFTAPEAPDFSRARRNYLIDLDME
jgi:23S rRNA pseudouridine1911/1915/1917 synthase